MHFQLKVGRTWTEKKEIPPTGKLGGQWSHIQAEWERTTRVSMKIIRRTIGHWARKPEWQEVPLKESAKSCENCFASSDPRHDISKRPWCIWSSWSDVNCTWMFGLWSKLSIWSAFMCGAIRFRSLSRWAYCKACCSDVNRCPPELM